MCRRHVYEVVQGLAHPGIKATKKLVTDKFVWPTLTLARTLLQGWIAHFGMPSIITSDRGSQFVSELWKHFATSLGIELHPTTAYHP